MEVVKMAFWIFMFIMELLIPLMMIVFGKVFSKGSPKKINGLVGYRTSRSMKNQETWQFAHQYFGKLWFVLGWICLIASALLMLPLLGKDSDTIGSWGSALCLLQCVVLIAPIYPTEKALKETFDENGVRK